MRICRLVRKRAQPISAKNVEKSLLSVLDKMDAKDGKFDFLMTYGGFLDAQANQEPMHRSWASTNNDLRPFIDVAEKKVKSHLTKKFYQKAKRKIRFLTLGVDVRAPRKNSRKIRSSSIAASSAELVAVIDVEQEKIIRWTGKSYPTSDQERTLVQVSDLKTHFMRLGNKNVLVLGCHDLNMFNPRGKATRKKGGARDKRCRDMFKLLQKHRPHVILQHAHCTDSSRIWRAAWHDLQKSLKDPRLVWATGIHYAFYGCKCTGKCNCAREDIQIVCEATRSSSKDVFDVKI